MANESFENAPLVEIVAELRWTPADLAAIAQQAAAPVLAISTSQPASVDQLLNTFLGEVYQHGYRQVERLVPPGFPTVLHQPVARFRQSQQHPALFQIGMGLFSANGLQPYRSWSDFRPVVQLGVDTLLKARIPADRPRPFSLLSLRYIDAFAGDLLNAQSITDFVSDTLGFSLQLPAPVDTLIEDPDTVKVQLQLMIPMKGSKKSMNLSLGEGTLATSPTTPALLMEMTITEPDIAPDLASIMSTFDSSRQIIHDMFVAITTKIHPLMKPRGD